MRWGHEGEVGKKAGADTEAEAMVDLIGGEGLAPGTVYNMQDEEGIWVSEVIKRR